MRHHHTAEIGGYVVEGHVPADALKRLLAERPGRQGSGGARHADGPPGMEMEGMVPDTYEIVL